MKQTMQHSISAALLAAAVSIVSVPSVLADTQTVDGVTYTYFVHGGQAYLGTGAWGASAITNTTAGALNIPATLGGCPVVGFRDYAFYECSGLTSVTIPDGVTRIGIHAFDTCRGLTNVTFGAGVASIGQWAFSECSGLTDLALPDSVTNIESTVFAGCTGLKEVSLGAGLTTIADGAFQYCSSLTGITVAAGNTSFTVADGVLYDSAKTRLLICPAGLGKTSFAVPATVERIGNTAFSSCAVLTNVTIAASVKSIGTSVFDYTALKNAFYAQNPQPAFFIVDGWVCGHSYSASGDLALPAGTRGIADQGLEDFTGLTSLVVPDAVPELGVRALDGCTKLTNLVIGAGVRTVGLYAIGGCSRLTSLTIPDGVTNIGAAAFMNCRGLTNLTLGAGVAAIADGAFRGCSSLARIAVAAGNTSFKVVDGILYDSAETRLVACPVLLGRDSVTIPATVKRIAYEAFFGCAGVTNVTLGAGVKSIGMNAFAGTGAENVFNSQTPPSPFFTVGGWVCGYSHTAAAGALALPAGTRGIADYGLAPCRGITSLEIPASVTDIGTWAFYNCSSLVRVDFLGDAPAIGADLYEGTPDGLTNFVKGGTTGWDGTAGSAALPASWPAADAGWARAISAGSVHVAFDVNGGTLSVTDRVYDVSRPFGELPMPVREKFEFTGWYTNSGIPIGMSPVTKDTLVTQTDDFTLHAYWLELHSLTVNGGTASTNLSTGGMAIGIAATNSGIFAGWQVEPTNAFIGSGFIGFDATKTVQTIMMPSMDLTLTAHYFNGPIAVSASDGASAKEIAVSWNPVTEGAIYSLYRVEGTNAISTAKLLATNLTATAYDDADVVTNVVYTYWVAALSPYGIGYPTCIPDSGFLKTGDTVLNETDPLAAGALPSDGTKYAATFAGLLYGDVAVGTQTVTTVRGLATLKVSGTSAKGKLTAQVTLQNKKLSFSSKSWGSADTNGSFAATLAAKSGETLSLTVRDGRMQGTLTGGSVDGTLELDGCRNRFAEAKDATGAAAKLAGFLGAYTFALPMAGVARDGGVDAVPEGAGFLSVTVRAKGAVRVTGMLGDGTKVSCSTALLDFGTEGGEMGVPVFAPLYSKKGWFGAMLWVNPDGTAFIESDYGWQGAWRKPGKGEDGFTAALDLNGGRLNAGAVPSSLVFTSSGAPEYWYRGAAIDAVAGALPDGLAVGFGGGKFTVAKATSPKKSGGAYAYNGATDAGLKLTLAASTGVVKGSYKLYYDSGATHKTASVKVNGVLLPGGVSGFGLVTETDSALKGYNKKRSVGITLE